MSRIGQQPIAIPDGVEVSVDGSSVHVKGKLGELSCELPASLSLAVNDGRAEVNRSDESKPTRSMHGTMRSLVNNMVQGVSQGYTKELVIEGVGYRAALAGSTVTLNVGYSHSIEYTAPEGVNLEVKDQTRIVVSGVDKQQVGLAAARIRSFCKAEPYKGKGIRYADERIRRKVGKTVA